MSLDQRMESETTRRRIIDPYALPMRRSLRTASLAGSHEPRAPTTKAVTTTRYPSRRSASARGEYLASFLALASWNACRRFSKGTVTSHMTTHLVGSCLITRSGRNPASSPWTPSTRWRGGLLSPAHHLFKFSGARLVPLYICIFTPRGLVLSGNI